MLKKDENQIIRAIGLFYGVSFNRKDVRNIQKLIVVREDTAYDVLDKAVRDYIRKTIKLDL